MYQQYRRTGVAEMRPVTQAEIDMEWTAMQLQNINISGEDLANGSPI